ncbi:MAG: hypothetical protein QXF15_02985 [Candidatus Aenigmatarchaeota archaeon]
MAIKKRNKEMKAIEKQSENKKRCHQSIKFNGSEKCLEICLYIKNCPILFCLINE